MWSLDTWFSVLRRRRSNDQSSDAKEAHNKKARSATRQVTTMMSTSVGPPNGFKLGNPPTYYNVSTNATFSGVVTVCINYAAASYHNEANLKLWHLSTSAHSWQNITTSLNTTARHSSTFGLGTTSVIRQCFVESPAIAQNAMPSTPHQPASKPS